MSNLFSHSPESASDDVGVPPARSGAVVVPVPVTEAFDGFTDGIHLWWPMESHSTFGVEAHVGFEKGVLLEDAFAGESSIWGEVRSWDEPVSLVIDWQLAGHPLTPTTVRVDFTTHNESSTTVTVTHDGWAPGRAGWQQYETYCDWPLILARFARFMGGAPALV